MRWLNIQATLKVLADLKEHAEQELRLAGLFDEDSDYGGMLAEAVVELMEVFAGQGHSGFSAMMTLDLFNRLGQYQTLTPITSEASEWNDVSEYSGCHMWQSSRNPAVFSEDGGKSWYNLDEV